MKKKILFTIGMALLSATALAVPSDLGPPITGGLTGDASTTEVRVTANVVQGIAVNEASPIDFGNLARGMYTGEVSQNIPGAIKIKGAASDVVNVKVDRTQLDLLWTGANGTVDTVTDAAKTTITGVNVHGLSTTDTAYTLDAAGNARQSLTASFTAGTGATDNLGSKQKLGSYVGSILVTATKKSAS